MLWLTTAFGPVWVAASSFRKLFTVASLVAGVASAGYFLSLAFAGGLHFNISKTGAGPLVVLIVPVLLSLLAIKQLWALCRSTR